MTADYRANTPQAFAELGYRLGDGPATLKPFVNLAYVSLHTDGFTETGGSAALRSRGGDTTSTFSTLGLRGSTKSAQARLMRHCAVWSDGGDPTAISRRNPACLSRAVMSLPSAVCR